MTHWKSYRVLFREGYHYFDLLKKAREFIQTFERNKILYKPFVIEKLNKGKLANPRYTYAEVYEDFEVWELLPQGWKSKKVR